MLRSKHVLALRKLQYVTSEKTLKPAAEVVLLDQVRLKLLIALVTDRGSHHTLELVSLAQDTY